MKKLDILYEDKDLLIVNKPPKMLTIAKDSNYSNNTLYHEVSDYVKKARKSNKIFIVHRLDKDTEGLVIFAKNAKIKKELQDNWSKVKREYLAVVEGKMPKNKDKLINYLKESKTLNVYVSKTGQKAITNYEVIATNKKYSLLKINIETGRRNQIRVQLSYLGNPIVGDKKYNARTNPINQLGLQAHRIVFIHPKTQKIMDICLPYPKYLERLNLTKE